MNRRPDRSSSARAPEDEIDLVELFYLLWGHALADHPLSGRGRRHRLRRDEISHYAKV